MTGRDPQPTTRQRSNGVCPFTATGLQLLFVAVLLLVSPCFLFAQDKIGATAGAAEERKSTPQPERGQTTEPQAPAPPLVSPIPEPAAPPFHVSEVKVEGTVDGDRADLSVHI